MCSEQPKPGQLGCPGEVTTVWLTPAVVLTAGLAAGVVLVVVYLSQYPAMIPDAWNPSQASLWVLAAVCSLAIASLGVPNGDVLAFRVGTWVQVAAFGFLVLAGTGSFLARFWPRESGA
ncbi:hypothetical protein [Natronosalvus rutilus]|uniref:Uncharacterized protein n=1 Tax=Natronosalvus rutilus TaxID=2953753 RepID=A0A9E7NDK5_9EURY|nr:hypothetical protein [Natronosalvus rutilus]UTF54772.1 hypothetical protein NGM29_05755 [Natronosalvus rutilus]